KGNVIGLQSQKEDVKEVSQGAEFGAMVKLDIVPQSGDQLVAFEVLQK
ncbi:MAG: hypothetical protein JWO43_562, partial [Candidatus Adlerbacteria bacterium]|nr:hypothetical protein [Candidatus Adlerbacteria bacterium]